MSTDSEFIKAAKKEFKVQMDAYFIKYNLNDSANTDLITATLLDPMYKGLSFVPENVNLNTYHSAAAKQIEDQTKHLTIKQTEPAKTKSGLSFKDLAGKGTSALTTSLKELKAYLSVPAGGSFSTFFQNFGTSYPRLAYAAVKFLLPPATSVPVERVFSHCSFQVCTVYSLMK